MEIIRHSKCHSQKVEKENDKRDQWIKVTNETHVCVLPK